MRFLRFVNRRRARNRRAGARSSCRIYHRFRPRVTRLAIQVAQQLSARIGHESAYWKSGTRVSEIDFLQELGTQVLPLEVKGGVNQHSKSLRSFVKKFMPSVALRSTLLNLRRDGAILNVPLYAIEQITWLARRAVA